MMMISLSEIVPKRKKKRLLEETEVSPIDVSVTEASKNHITGQWLRCGRWWICELKVQWNFRLRFNSPVSAYTVGVWTVYCPDCLHSLERQATPKGKTPPRMRIIQDQRNRFPPRDWLFISFDYRAYCKVSEQAITLYFKDNFCIWTSGLGLSLILKARPLITMEMILLNICIFKSTFIG